MAYFSWGQQTLTDWSDAAINTAYAQGYLFTRLGKGVMNQTRSLRIDLTKFELTSENRRVLHKTEALSLEKFPLPYANYHWTIGKMAKDFYEHKFGSGTFSAFKIKELMTDEAKSNFNTLLVYSLPIVILNDAATSSGHREEFLSPSPNGQRSFPLNPARGQDDKTAIGYCIARETRELLHYAYPFYLLSAIRSAVDSASSPPVSRQASYQLLPNTGIGIMLRAILWAKDRGKQYLYLGSFSRLADTYKLQFAGLEWWSGRGWKKDLDKLKKILTPKI
ncbi:MAG: hypothetical protein HYV42_01015 [Candidatus Magasanikbacteria bacterium]|nr:hypothetical protein [Candidatus Magasanikbacteria bacterium]